MQEKEACGGESSSLKYLFDFWQVLWEVFSDSISGILPTVRDLIFLAETKSSVYSPDEQRPHIGTKVLFFDGGAGK